MWAVFAVLSAVFAALTSILAKIGIDGVNPYHGGRCHGMGHGIFDPYTEWDHGDQQEVLAVFNLIQSGNRCILAVLLQGFADGRGI